MVCTGQAGGRAALSLERVAINVNDARIADNAGAQPVDTPVVAGGPAAYFTSLPIKAMLVALLAEGINAEVSQTAGTFVCNHVFYGLMHELATRHELGRTRGGLIHVPWLPAQGQPSMRLDEIVAGPATGDRLRAGDGGGHPQGSGRAELTASGCTSGWRRHARVKTRHA